MQDVPAAPAEIIGAKLNQKSFFFQFHKIQIEAELCQTHDKLELPPKKALCVFCLISYRSIWFGYCCIFKYISLNYITARSFIL